MRTATFQFSEPDGSLNGQDLFTEVCTNPYKTPHSLNASPLLTEKLFLHQKVFRRIPFPKTGSYLHNLPLKGIHGGNINFLLLCVSFWASVFFSQRACYVAESQFLADLQITHARRGAPRQVELLLFQSWCRLWLDRRLQKSVTCVCAASGIFISHFPQCC